MQKLAVEGHLTGEKEHHLSDDLEVFARTALLPETPLLAVVLQAGPAGGIVAGSDRHCL